MRPQLERLCTGQSLSQPETRELFERVVQGDCSEPLLAALLIALRIKGEQSAEIAGAAAALRANALPFPRPEYEFADCCGTGGDGAGTLNVSTAVAFVLAECGLPVAKHGNRSVSSRSGSADVLETLGLKLDPSPQTSHRMLDETGFCFLFAPQYHAGVKHAMPVRRALATRTLFNLLGPLSHPAAPPLQLLGVYDAARCRTLAESLRELGCREALVVNGGIDEIALHGATRVARLHAGEISELEIAPADAGLKTRPLSELAGGDASFNASALEALLRGKHDDAYAEAVALNAGALLWACGRNESLRDGCERALETIRSGRAIDRLSRAVELSHGE